THLAGFRHRSPVDGRVHRQRQRRHVLPGWVVHHPVDDDGRRDASNGERDVARGFGRSLSGLRRRGKRRDEKWNHDSDTTDRLRHSDVPEVTKWSRCLVRSGARCDTGPRVSALRHNTGQSAAAPVVGYRVFLAIVVTAYFTLIALTPRTEMMPEVDWARLIPLSVLYVVLGIWGFDFARRRGQVFISLAYLLSEFYVGMRINGLAWGGGLPLILLPLAAQAVMLLPRVLAAAMCLLVIAGVSGNLSWVPAWPYWPRNIAQATAAVVFVVVYVGIAERERKARERAEALTVELA